MSRQHTAERGASWTPWLAEAAPADGPRVRCQALAVRTGVAGSPGLTLVLLVLWLCGSCATGPGGGVWAAAAGEVCHQAQVRAVPGSSHIVLRLLRRRGSLQLHYVCAAPMRQAWHALGGVLR
jgi:hypothetical protein